MNELPFVSSASGTPKVPGVALSSLTETGTGFVWSTTTTTLLVAIFPAVSVAVIVNVCVPSLRSSTSIVLLKSPFPSRVTVISSTPACPLVVGSKASLITTLAIPFASVTLVPITTSSFVYLGTFVIFAIVGIA